MRVLAPRSRREPKPWPGRSGARCSSASTPVVPHFPQHPRGRLWGHGLPFPRRRGRQLVVQKKTRARYGLATLFVSTQISGFGKRSRADTRGGLIGQTLAFDPWTCSRWLPKASTSTANFVAPGSGDPVILERCLGLPNGLLKAMNGLLGRPTPPASWPTFWSPLRLPGAAWHLSSARSWQGAPFRVWRLSPRPTGCSSTPV